MSSFLEKVITDKPAIYHILDGYLGDGIDGYTARKVNLYLKNNELDKIHKTDQTVQIVTLYDDEFNITKILSDLNTNIVSIFNLNMKTSEGDHAMSLLIYYNNDTYHIFLINSGFGIDQFESNQGRVKEGKMVPFDYFIISDQEIVKKLLQVILILNSGKIDSMTKTEFLYDIIKDHIIIYIENSIENSIKMPSKWIDWIEWKRIQQYKKLELNLAKSSFYYIEIVHKILGVTAKFNLPIILFDWEKSKLPNLNLPLNVSHSYNKFILEKICFDSDFVVIPQQQGTCTWFCKYWALLIANIILNGDYIGYIYMVYKCAIEKLIEMLLLEDNETFVSKITLETKLKNLGIITFNRNVKFVNKTLQIDYSHPTNPSSLSEDPLEKLRKIIINFIEDISSHIIIDIVKFIIEYPDFNIETVLFNDFPTEEEFANVMKIGLYSDTYLLWFFYLKKFYNKIKEIELKDDNIYLLQIQILYVITFLYPNNTMYDNNTLKKMVIKYYYIAIYITVCILYLEIKNTHGDVQINTDIDKLYGSFIKITVVRNITNEICSTHCIHIYNFFSYNFKENIFYHKINDQKHFIDIKNISDIVYDFFNPTMSITDIFKLRDLLLNNPILIFNRFNNRNIFKNFSIFIILNIKFIDQDPILKSKLLRFFLNSFYDHYNSDRKTYLISLIHLQYLFFGAIDFEQIPLNETEKNSEYSVLQFFSGNPSVTINTLEIILKYFKSNTETKEDFTKKVIEIMGSDHLRSDICGIFAEYHNITDYNDNYKYTEIDKEDSPLLFFGSDIYVSVFVSDSISTTERSYYIFNYNFYVKITTTGTEIQSIHYKGVETKPLDQINLPFIKLLPDAGC
jgi:hypothetical protein